MYPRIQGAYFSSSNMLDSLLALLFDALFFGTLPLFMREGPFAAGPSPPRPRLATGFRLRSSMVSLPSSGLIVIGG